VRAINPRFIRKDPGSTTGSCPTLIGDGAKVEGHFVVGKAATPEEIAALGPVLARGDSGIGPDEVVVWVPPGTIHDAG
jgi:hypothetical protein